MPSAEIIHFSKLGDQAFVKRVTVYSGEHPIVYAEELHREFNQLKVFFAAILRDFPVAETKLGIPSGGSLRQESVRAGVVALLSQTHRFLKICGVFYRDFEAFVEVADRRVTELVHRFNHQATVNYHGFQEFETLVDDCMNLVNNDSCYQLRIKFQRAMATHMELLGTIKNYSRMATSQITCVAKAQALVEFSRKVLPFLEMVGHYVERLCERDDMVCLMRRARNPHFSCHGHVHHAVQQAFKGVCQYYTLFKAPETFMAKIQEYDETLAQVDREASKSEWLLEHFYKTKLLPVQERLHESIVGRERFLGDGVVCD